MSYIDNGFDKTLYRSAQAGSSVLPDSSGTIYSGGDSYTGSSDSSPSISSPITDGVSATSIISGSLDQILYSKKTGFFDTTNGWIQGLDKDGVYKWLIGGASSSIDWSVTTPGTLTVKGTITATSGTIGGWTINATTLTGGNTTLDSTGVITLGTGNNIIELSSVDSTYRLWVGNTTAASAPFSVTQAGAILSTSGTIGGWTIASTTLSATGITLDSGNQKITVGSGPPSITIDGANTRIRSSNYSAGVSGFTVEPTLIEAENLVARGIMKGATFQYDVVSAVGGQLVVSNADVMDADMTALDAATMTTKGTTTWSANDIIDVRAVTGSGIQEEYMRVTGLAVQLVDSYSESNASAASTLYSGSATISVGQVFNSGSGGTLDSCKFYLKKNGSPTGNAFAKVYAISGTPGVNAKPSGAVLATSDAVDTSTLSTSNSLVTFNFSGGNRITLSASTSYAVAIVYSTGGNASNDVWAWGDLTSPTHNGNFFYSANESTWTSVSGTDLCFYVYKTQSNVYSLTRDLAAAYSADSNPTWQKGTTIVKVGVSDGASAFSGGWLRLFGQGTNAPYYSVFSRTGVAYNAYTEVLRAGNLNGFLDYVADTFGFAVGSSSGTNANITIDPTNGLRIRNGTTNVITLDNSGNVTVNKITATSGTIAAFTISSSTISATNLTITSGAANTANITVGTGSTAGGLNSANSSSDIVFWAGDTFANRATAPFHVAADGSTVMTNATVTGTFTGSASWVPTVSNNLKASADTVGTGAASVYTKHKVITLGAGVFNGSSGALRIAFDIKANAGGASVNGKIERNGVDVGSVQTNNTTSYVTYSQDISGWTSGDTVELWVREAGGISHSWRNFRIYYDRTTNPETTVTLDS